MMNLDFGTLVTVGLAIVSLIVWLVRLEGRVNTAEKATAEVIKDLDATNVAHKIEITAIKAKAESDALASGETTIALVRVQEQLKYLTSLFERHFVEGPVPRPRRGAGS